MIADNVGDNVGDCAGMAADLFETYVVTVGITMVTVALALGASPLLVPLMGLPLLIGGVCIITSIIGTYMVRLGAKESIMGALYKGFWTATILAVPAIYGAAAYALGDLNQVITTTGGPQLPGDQPGLGQLRRPGRHRADRVDHRILHRHQLSPGPVDRQGQPDRPWHQRHPGPGDQPGIDRSADARDRRRRHRQLAAGRAARRRLRRSAMLALAGMVVALDAYGPVTDNAGGIAEMSGLEDEVRNRTDALDAVGNTTKAVTKGYAIGSAGLAALVLFGAYTADLEEFGA